MQFVGRARRRNGVRAAAASALDRRFFKTKLCTFFAEGKCSRGSRCTYAHMQTDLTAPPDLFHTQACREHFLKGFCEQGDACPYAHKMEDLRSVPSRGFYQLRSENQAVEGSNNASSPSSTTATDHTAMEKPTYGSDCGTTSSMTSVKGSYYQALHSRASIDTHRDISRQSTEDVQGDSAWSEFSESDEEAKEGDEDNSASRGPSFQWEKRKMPHKRISWADLGSDSDEEPPPALGLFTNLRRAVSENAPDGGRLELVMKNTFLEAVESKVPGASRRSASAGP
eukprot:CAMPEP_0170622496 /NCGR_PEP_ID=MMETSP0224-20130122/29164_1 /TAXON_ID=285029 /ORGANISM="Togula jolla, Strain CCCM 725" /LENGTH=282 /DNA_ID=CAMNT_0010948823 /DNA_START=56 /DNA_END=904 /DNA_ORIENTATION=+